MVLSSMSRKPKGFQVSLRFLSGKHDKLNIQLIRSSFVHEKIVLFFCSNRASSAIFFKEEMNRLKEEIPHLQERFLKVSEMWTNLPKQDKEKYKEMVKEGELKYQKELQKWFQVLAVYFVLIIKMCRFISCTNIN